MLRVHEQPRILSIKNWKKTARNDGGAVELGFRLIDSVHAAEKGKVIYHNHEYIMPRTMRLVQ